MRGLSLLMFQLSHQRPPEIMTSGLCHSEVSEPLKREWVFATSCPISSGLTNACDLCGSFVGERG